MTSRRFEDAPKAIKNLMRRLAELERRASRKGHGGWETYTPVLEAGGTPVTLGTGGVASGRFRQHGDHVEVQAFFRYGTSGISIGSGTYTVTLPVPIVAEGFTRRVVGSSMVRDANTSTAYNGVCRTASDQSEVDLIVTDSNSDAGQLVTSTAPFTWAGNDELSIAVAYPSDL